MRAITVVGAATLALILAGCGNGSDATTTPSATASGPSAISSVSATAATPAGPVAFIEWAKKAELGTKDPSLASDELLLSVGASGCDLMASAPSFGWAVNEMVKTLKESEVTPGDMDAWLRQSVINLCPQHKDLLP